MDDLDKKIKDLLFDIGRIIHFGSERRRTQLEILEYIGSTHSLSLKDIQRKMKIKAGSASEIISKLEKRGYITRCFSESDRRKIALEITESGRLFLKSAENTRKNAIFSFLSEEEKISLCELLEKVYASWRER